MHETTNKEGSKGRTNDMIDVQKEGEDLTFETPTKRGFISPRDTIFKILRNKESIRYRASIIIAAFVIFPTCCVICERSTSRGTNDFGVHVSKNEKTVSRIFGTNETTAFFA